MRKKTPPSVLAKQVDLLYQTLPSSLLTSATIALCFLFFLKNFPNPKALQTWVASMLLLFLLRAFTVILYQKIKKRDSFRVEQAEALFLTGVVLSGIGWGSLAGWLYPMTNDQSTHIVFFVVVTGVAGGAIPSLSYRQLPIQLFTCLTVLPILIGLYRTPGTQKIALGLITIAYTIFIIKSGRIFQKHHEQMFLLKEKALTREVKLRIASKKAEAANRAKSRFLANMSHEIRTPMNSIIGQTRLAIDEEHDPKIQFHLNIIKNSSENLLSLINDILDFSKIEAGELKINNKPFDLHIVIQSILETIRVLAEDKKGLQLRCKIASNVPHAIIGDKQRLRQILLNLLNNGIKFTDTGCIDLFITRLKTEDASLQLQFKVCDTGIGIAFEKQKIIFDEFAQEDDSSTRQYGGTGLGLAICRQLCQLMEGDIEVESTPTKGSTFTCSIPFLPCHTSDLPAETNLIKTKQRQNSPLFLLLVEDNEANRILATMVLEGANHQLMEAHNGLQALNLLSEHTFDAILMDIQMPVMDGYSATNAIRSAEQGSSVSEVDQQLAEMLRNRLNGSHTPIIAMTANAMNGDREKCLAAGMDEYLAKPFHPDELNSVFRKLNIKPLSGKQEKS